MTSRNKKDFEEKIKKLEYQNRQSANDLHNFQQALNQETMKRQMSEEKVLVTDNSNKELKEDLRQLSETLEKKEDELMMNYQDY